MDFHTASTFSVEAHEGVSPKAGGAATVFLADWGCDLINQLNGHAQGTRRINPRGKVARLTPECTTVWLTRDTALFAALEWGWSPNEADAYVFSTYDDPASNDDARKKRDELYAQGLRCVWPAIADSEEERAYREQLREQNEARSLAEQSALEADLVRRGGRNLPPPPLEMPARRSGVARRRGPAMSVEEIERLRVHQQNLERMHLD